MSTSSFPALAAFFCFIAFTSIAADPTPDPTPDPAPPALTIDDALAIAKSFVQKNQINVSRSYIDSARLDSNPGGGKFWLITWLRNEYASGIPIKGGQTYLKVYMDKSAQITYGE